MADGKHGRGAGRGATGSVIQANKVLWSDVALVTRRRQAEELLATLAGEPDTARVVAIRGALGYVGKRTDGVPARVLVLRRGGEIAGAVAYTQTGAKSLGGKNLYVEYVGARGGGVGTRLMYLVAWEAQKAGVGFELTAVPSMDQKTGDWYDPAPFYRHIGMVGRGDILPEFMVPQQNIAQFLDRHKNAGWV